MPVLTRFYLDQVAICGKSAAGAVLDNEREKYLRSQAAWQALADRKLQTLAQRATREADRPVDDDAPLLAESSPDSIAQDWEHHHVN